MSSCDHKVQAAQCERRGFRQEASVWVALRQGRVGDSAWRLFPFRRLTDSRGQGFSSPFSSLIIGVFSRLLVQQVAPRRCPVPLDTLPCPVSLGTLLYTPTPSSAPPPPSHSQPPPPRKAKQEALPALTSGTALTAMVKPTNPPTMRTTGRTWVWCRTTASSTARLMGR
jgi:hypothetical protein